jgi:neopullulanase
MTISTPHWVKQAIFYQIFPDSFARTIPDQQRFLLDAPLEAWDAPPTVQRYKGGNLWGLIDRLDYLQDLGITALYLNPIFQSACNHRYHTHDYYQVDPLLGGNEAFLELLKQAHQRNLKVILDGVFNHASRGFLFFNDILEHGPNSPWVDWFIIKKWPLSAYDGSRPANYESWENLRSLPKFNHDHLGVREYWMRVAEYWLNVGIDGWRLDVPNCITAPGFWQEFRQRVKAINPEAYIVGEIFSDATQWLDGTQFDGVMNYPFGRATIAFAAGHHVQKAHVRSHYNPAPALDAEGYGTEIRSLLDRYPWEIQLSQLNLLDSHDVARLTTIVGGDRSSIELALLLLFTFPGSPNIFYGDEVGLTGSHEPDCRGGFPSPDQWDLEIQALYRNLIALRHRYSALRTGDYQILVAQSSVYVFARILRDQVLIVAVNSGYQVVDCSIRLQDAQTPEKVRSVFCLKPDRLQYGTGKATWIDEEMNGENESFLNLSMQPRDGCVLVAIES